MTLGGAMQMVSMLMILVVSATEMAMGEVCWMGKL